ncbi:GntR family transcriptional regulator [Burkholderia cepacia]|uniref:GntR family transcriptional regulator n=1 Tax=Burkholderia cepacia TaxID=292 RepID=UPI00158A2D51|nr:GntR family transcriptional regulator [Burkholderia cepacia]
MNKLFDASRKRGASLTEQAYAIVREKIITGELPPGSDISEPELAEQLQMSKTPVREALGRLCVEGLMEAFPRRGYRITPVTMKDISDLFAVRATLEGMAAALAASNLSDDELDMLDRLADASYVVGEGTSTKSFVASNEKFHLAIAQGSRNPRLVSLVMSHLEECDRLHYIGARSRDINPETNTDHHEIVAALRRRDAVEARRAVVEHIENTRRGLLESFIASSHGAVTL